MRNFANRYHRQMVAGFAGDLAPADPMAAGLEFTMELGRLDKPDQPTRRFQGFFVSSVALLTCDFQLWIHGALTDWIQVDVPLLAVGQNVAFEVAGDVFDAIAFVQVTPSAALAGVDTIDLYLEEVD